MTRVVEARMVRKIVYAVFYQSQKPGVRVMTYSEEVGDCGHHFEYAIWGVGDAR
jgi:hypothetical protein